MANVGVDATAGPSFVLLSVTVELVRVRFEQLRMPPPTSPEFEESPSLMVTPVMLALASGSTLRIRVWCDDAVPSMVTTLWPARRWSRAGRHLN